jgi:hypothetical protein
MCMNVVVLSHLWYLGPLVMNFYGFVANCGCCFKGFFFSYPMKEGGILLF